jgi:hypothetical protein
MTLTVLLGSCSCAAGLSQAVWLQGSLQYQMVRPTVLTRT